MIRDKLSLGENQATHRLIGMPFASTMGLAGSIVTHDIDEALYLADRIVLMTDGPSSRVGEIIGVPFERPRGRAHVLKHRDYQGLRNRVLDFLENHANHGRN